MQRVTRNSEAIDGTQPSYIHYAPFDAVNLSPLYCLDDDFFSSKTLRKIYAHVTFTVTMPETCSLLIIVFDMDAVVE